MANRRIQVAFRIVLSPIETETPSIMIMYPSCFSLSSFLTDFEALDSKKKEEKKKRIRAMEDGEH